MNAVSLSDNYVQNYNDEELEHNTLQSNIWYDASVNAVFLSDMSKITTMKSYILHNTLQSNGMTHDDVVMFTSPQLSFHWQANEDDIPGPVPPRS